MNCLLNDKMQIILYFVLFILICPFRVAGGWCLLPVKALQKSGDWIYTLLLDYWITEL